MFTTKLSILMYQLGTPIWQPKRLARSETDFSSKYELLFLDVLCIAFISGPSEIFQMVCASVTERKVHVGSLSPLMRFIPKTKHTASSK